MLYPLVVLILAAAATSRLIINAAAPSAIAIKVDRPSPDVGRHQ